MSVPLIGSCLETAFFDSPSSANADHSPKISIIIGISLSVLMVLLGLFGSYYWRHRRRKRQQQAMDIDQAFIGSKIELPGHGMERPQNRSSSEIHEVDAYDAEIGRHEAGTESQLHELSNAAVVEAGEASPGAELGNAETLFELKGDAREMPQVNTRSSRDGEYRPPEVHLPK